MVGSVWLDYGARFYDPQIGRFTTQDPMAELTNRVTPYHYGNKFIMKKKYTHEFDSIYKSRFSNKMKDSLNNSFYKN